MDEFIYPADEIFEDMLFESPNMRQMETGLPMPIWVSPSNSKEKHCARIKVSTSHSRISRHLGMVSVSISKLPKLFAGSGLSSKDLTLVKEFISINHDALLDYWNSAIEFEELQQRIVMMGA